MIREPDFNMDSLRRHRVSKTECLEVLADPLKFRADQEESKRGNIRRMYVGKTVAGRTLEVGVEFLSNEKLNIYHARKATSAMKEEAGYEEE